MISAKIMSGVKKMNKQEFGKITLALSSYYPTATIVPTKEAFELWYNQLKDIPYEIAELSVNKWVATNKWPPTIADIREMAVGISIGEKKDWSEAWEEVQDAIRKFGFYEASKALESLSPLTKETVNKIGFTAICQSENPTADRANFRMIYESLAQREKMKNQIPLQLRELISNIKLLGDNENG